VLEAVEENLNADPGRADVVHDLLAHLAREMTRLKNERQTHDLDITNWMTAPSKGKGIGLREIGRYQPAEGVTETVLADKTDERAKLHIDRLIVETASTDDDTVPVHVRAIARFKPEGERESWPAAVPETAEPDRHDYVATEPIDVCTLHGCDKIETGLVVHWLRALNDKGNGFSGYRDNATSRDYSLLDRTFNIRLPDPSDDSVRDALRPFLNNAEAAAELDAQIGFTDALIDQIVYRLYGLTDGEVAVVERGI